MKLILPSVILTFLMIFTNASAAPQAQAKSAQTPVNIYKQQKARFISAEAAWHKMNKSQKLAYANKRFEENQKSSKAAWAKMSDDKKLQFQEKSFEMTRKNLGLKK